MRVLSTDNSTPTIEHKGTIALRCQLFLAKLTLLYYHGNDDYYNLKHPDCIALQKAIKDGENALNNNSNNIDEITSILKQLRENYKVEISVKAK